LGDGVNAGPERGVVEVVVGHGAGAGEGRWWKWNGNWGFWGFASRSQRFKTKRKCVVSSWAGLLSSVQLPMQPIQVKPTHVFCKFWIKNELMYFALNVNVAQKYIFRTKKLGKPNPSVNRRRKKQPPFLLHESS
jgi:hypothetical protein